MAQLKLSAGLGVLRSSCPVGAFCFTLLTNLFSHFGLALIRVLIFCSKLFRIEFGASLSQHLLRQINSIDMFSSATSANTAPYIQRSYSRCYTKQFVNVPLEKGALFSHGVSTHHKAVSSQTLSSRLKREFEAPEPQELRGPIQFLCSKTVHIKIKVWFLLLYDPF